MERKTDEQQDHGQERRHNSGGAAALGQVLDLTVLTSTSLLPRLLWLLLSLTLLAFPCTSAPSALQVKSLFLNHALPRAWT